MFGYCNSVDAIGKGGNFVNLHFKLDYFAEPVKLNDNEIFFAGNWDGVDWRPVLGAQKYDIKQKKLIDLKSKMIVPRDSYGAIKYDDNHILIVGGEHGCTQRECQNDSYNYMAEIYDIKANKFTRISDTNLPYSCDVQTLLLEDGRVLIYGYGAGSVNEHYEVFDPKTNTFKKIVKNDKYFTDKDLYDGKVFQLNSNEILIIGRGGSQPGTFSPKMNILNLKTGEVELFNPDKRIYKGYINWPLRIDSKTLLFTCQTEDKYNVLLDVDTKTVTKLNKCPDKPINGKKILLPDTDRILYLWGIIKPSDVSFAYFMPGKDLSQAVYDYKKNKLYKYKTRISWWDSLLGTHVRFIPLKNAIYIHVHEPEKNMLYKYK